MKLIHVVIAYGGKYEDAWTRNIRAFETIDQAINLITNYERWLTELRDCELPESLAGHDIDWDDQDQTTNLQIGIDEFWSVVLAEMGVPEDDRTWLLENLQGSYDCDQPSYQIDSLEYQEQV